MEESQWLSLRKHLAVYMVEVYCCKLCNDFSSTHKTLVASHLQSVHPTEMMEQEEQESSPVETSTVADTEVQATEEEEGSVKEEEDAKGEELALARQVAESENIEKTILQMLQTNSDVLGQDTKEEEKDAQGENKENKQSKKSKKRKRARKREESKVGPKRRNRKLCKLCGYCTKSSEELNAHLQTHYEDPDSRACDLCQAEFKTYEELIRHTRKGCTPCQKMFKCEECGKTCQDRRAIIEHMVVHSEDRPYACRICGKSYKTKKILRRHEGIHAMARDTFQCPECAFKTHWKTNIKRHILEVHKKDSRPLFSCTHCPFTTPNKRYIEKHRFGHWKDCPYMCENCGKMFKSEMDLESHKQMHIQPDIAWQLIQLQNSEPQLVEETIAQYQPQIMHSQEIQIHEDDGNLQGAVQVTMTEQDETKTIVLSQIPVVQYLDIVTGDVVTGQE